jgi:membrane associated rhomboid family serine protease
MQFKNALFSPLHYPPFFPNPSPTLMPITYLIIGTTVLISFMAFNNAEILYRFKHWPYAEARRKEYHRWLTGGFLHGDYMHLLFNMFTLYFFGKNVEWWFQALFPQVGVLLFAVFYLVAIVASSAATYYKHKDNPGFASIGASGAVSAVLFASILLDPAMSIYIFLIPIPIPGFIYGIFFLWYSNYAANRAGDNIDHLAHFYGAVFGFIFPLTFKPELFMHFLAQLQRWLSGIVG